MGASVSGECPEYTVRGKGQETGEFVLLRDEMEANPEILHLPSDPLKSLFQKSTFGKKGLRQPSSLPPPIITRGYSENIVSYLREKLYSVENEISAQWEKAFPLEKRWRLQFSPGFRRELPEYAVTGKVKAGEFFILLRDEMGRGRVISKVCFVLILLSVWLTQVRVK
ncbi:hypothetical protein CEXT_156021 [Caerostris extrusa]|uniref:Uncharacterized protein n=1 Tax=Caerostris extrusa TaxID=172846 RepID=A0AAV4Q9L3_CAEEX|nr:hypothetical protein CEXT_156021 [Caerostris extrusa]